MKRTFAERHTFLCSLVMLGGAAVPGVILWFAAGHSTAMAVLAGVLGVPSAVVAALIVEAVA